MNERKAITAAKVYLEMRGYNIRELNWRQSRHRIDVIAEKDQAIFLIEVTRNQPNGTTTVSQSKFVALKLAAEAWVEETKWHGKYSLATVEIAEPNNAVIGFNDAMV